MIQYFQLTPEILLEYIYEGDPKLNEDNIKGNSKDIYDDSPTILLKSEAFTSKYLCFKNENEGLDSFSNLVLPLNNTETQFVVAKSKYQNFFSKSNSSNRFLSKNGSGYLYVDTNYDSNIKNKGESCDVRYDKCIIHFTSRNYFGSYESLIFQAYSYMKDKSKLYFASFLFKKTSNLEMTPEQLLYNEKLYTTQIQFDIPSVFAILSKDEEIFNEDFNVALNNQNIELLENTPIGINVYGVSGTTKGTDNYEKLNTLKISSIAIPYVYNRFDEIHVNISEALDGDFYYIDPEMGHGYSSFVDYIETMGEDIRSYMIMHELYLRESWVDSDGKQHSEITHKEYHIIDIHEDDEDDEISNRFDAKIKYRPICIHGGLNYKATIIDTIKILNTVDSSSYEVTGSLEISNPNKYGKKIKKLDFNNELRPIINVYNKKLPSTSGSSGVVTGSKQVGSLSGSFNIPGSGSFSGNISGYGYVTGIITCNISESGLISGMLSGELSSGGFIFGKFSISGDSITGTIYGYIPGIGYVSGTISGSSSNNGIGNIGNITAAITNSNSSYGNEINGLNGLNGSNGLNSGSNGNGIVVLNKGGGFKVENMTQNITSFIECTNIGVSISELSPEDIN